MSRDIRISDNHALIAAQKSALESKLPVIIVFNVLPKTGHRSREHYEFMISGLKEVEQEAKKLNIGFVITSGEYNEQILNVVEKLKPKELFFDFSPLRGPRKKQKMIASSVNFRVSVVDTHNIIPVWITSNKEELAAHTIRNKIHKNLSQWAVEPEKLTHHPYKVENVGDVGQPVDLNTELDKLVEAGVNIDIIPGEAAAKKTFREFYCK
jgi:deoxyribodipyrimidine photo-lyase